MKEVADHIFTNCPKCNKPGEFLWQSFDYEVICEFCKRHFILDYSIIERGVFPYVVMESASNLKHKIFHLAEDSGAKSAAKVAVSVEFYAAIEINNAIKRNKEIERTERYKGYRMVHYIPNIPAEISLKYERECAEVLFPYLSKVLREYREHQEAPNDKRT